MSKDLTVSVDLMNHDKVKQLTALTAEAIPTHPNRDQLLRALFEIVGDKDDTGSMEQ